MLLSPSLPPHLWSLEGQSLAHLHFGHDLRHGTRGIHLTHHPKQVTGNDWISLYKFMWSTIIRTIIISTHNVFHPLTTENRQCCLPTISSCHLCPCYYCPIKFTSSKSDSLEIVQKRTFVISRTMVIRLAQTLSSQRGNWSEHSINEVPERQACNSGAF